MWGSLFGGGVGSGFQKHFFFSSGRWMYSGLQSLKLQHFVLAPDRRGSTDFLLGRRDLLCVEFSFHTMEGKFGGGCGRRASPRLGRNFSRVTLGTGPSVLRSCVLRYWEILSFSGELLVDPGKPPLPFAVDLAA